MVPVNKGPRVSREKKIIKKKCRKNTALESIAQVEFTNSTVNERIITVVSFLTPPLTQYKNFDFSVKTAL